MNIDDFSKKYGTSRKNSNNIVNKWKNNEVEYILDNIAFSSVFLSNAIEGDGITNRIPPDLFEALNKVYVTRNIETYGDARTLLREYLDKDDRAVMGFVNKVKGQIGENKFSDDLGGAARLARSPTQEGWDIVIEPKGEPPQFIQVKLYSDPKNVLKHAQENQEKIGRGQILDENSIPVDQLDYAVPHNIQLEVENMFRVAGIDSKVLPIPMTAEEGKDLVYEGLDNLSSNAIPHFFEELLAGVATPTAIAAAINSFQYARVAKAAEDAANAVFESAVLSGTAHAVGYVTEVALDSVLDTMLSATSFGVGTTTRILLKKAFKSRKNLYEVIKVYRQNMELNLYKIST